MDTFSREPSRLPGAAPRTLASEHLLRSVVPRVALTHSILRRWDSR